MWLSCDYVFRRTSGVHVNPRGKHEIDDKIFGPLMALQSGHQLFLDISRLTLVSSASFRYLSLCGNVQFLDVSYNRVEAEHIALLGEHCITLRALVLAGIKFTNSVEDYRPLGRLAQLELLSLRQAENVTSAECLRGLVQLRSLDLGETAVASLAPLAGLTRLEELALDGCSRLGGGRGGDSGCDDMQQRLQMQVQTLSTANLPNLRLLNVQDTALAAWRDSLLEVLHEDVCLEVKARRELFVEAVINNDDAALRRLVGSGQDINIRVGPWGAAILADAWRSRGRAAKLQAPFFLCTHDDEELRPTALHLALYFNAQDCLAFLRFMNADTRQRVWMGDVEESRGVLAMIAARLQAAGKEPVFSTPDLLDAVYDRFVHRLTMGMVAKKQTDWKKRCIEAREDLKLVFDHKFVLIVEKRRVAAAKQAELDRIERERRAREEAQIMAQIAAKAAQEKEEREADKRALIYGGGSGPPSVAWPAPGTSGGAKKSGADGDGDSVASRAMDSLSQGSLSLDTGSVDDAGIRVHDAPLQPEPVVLEVGHVVEPEAEKKMVEEEKAEEEEEEEEPAVYKKAGRKPLKMLDMRPTGFQWRGHAMVSKLLDPPQRFKSTRSLLDVEVLGPRSFWLEQCRVVLADRLAREDAQAAEAARLVATDRQARADYERNKMQRGLKEYVPEEPVPVRTEDFLELVKKDRDRKYIVRDDISVPEEEAGSDSDKSL